MAKDKDTATEASSVSAKHNILVDALGNAAESLGITFELADDASEDDILDAAIVFLNNI